MATAGKSLLHQKTLCVITGASRGIGKEIAVQLASNVSSSSKFLLLARNEKDLVTTKEEIQKKNPGISVEIFPSDLGKFTEIDTVLDFERKLTSFLVDVAPFDVASIVHNAGTLGDISRPVAQVDQSTEIQEYLDLNVVSCMILNNVFLRVVASGDKGAKQRVIVNISSLLAIKSLPGFGLYAVGKAAREAYMRSLAAEDASLRVLNYAPGPIKTDMTDHIAKTVWNEETRQWFQSAHDNGTLLTTGQTVKKFLKVLDENTFENASHIDYYDLPE